MQTLALPLLHDEPLVLATSGGFLLVFGAFVDLVVPHALNMNAKSKMRYFMSKHSSCWDYTRVIGARFGKLRQEA